MLQIPSPILVYGDVYLSRNVLTSIKNKCDGATWIVMDANNLDEIRMEAGASNLDGSDKVLVLQNIPNKKNVREFLLNLQTNAKLIIWDSENHIKVDPKTKCLDKTWQEFLDAFKNIKGNKIINNGEVFSDKDEGDIRAFITKCFTKFNKVIDDKDIRLLVNIVGSDRGLLFSDIKKMCMSCGDRIDSKFIIENAFPSNKEAILYKLGNVLDSGNYEDAITMLEQYLSNDINPNVIAEIFIKKARWQLIVVHLWFMGWSWSNIANKLMEMGKFPSSIWHNEDFTTQQKQQESEPYQGAESMFAYMVKKEGIPSNYLKKPKEEKKKTKGVMTRKGSEILPFYFIAQQTVDFVRNRLVGDSNDKQRVLDKALNNYSFCQEKLTEIRYGNNVNLCLQEMVRKLV